MAAAPDPMAYSYSYGPPSVMPPHFAHGPHGLGHSRGVGGGGGVVPFRAGDWKCGSEGCGYHNFAKNINCLRCGAPRSGAAVIADSAFPTPMEPPSGFGMGPSSMASTPAPGPFASPAGGFGGFGQQFAPPPTNYALPSGLGAAPGGAYPPMGGMNPTGYSSANNSLSAAAFANPATQAAFSGADQITPSTNASNGAFYGLDGPADPFAFLSSGLGPLGGVDDHARRNGASAKTQG